VTSSHGRILFFLTLGGGQQSGQLPISFHARRGGGRGPEPVTDGPSTIRAGKRRPRPVRRGSYGKSSMTVRTWAGQADDAPSLRASSCDGVAAAHQRTPRGP